MQTLTGNSITASQLAAMRAPQGPRKIVIVDNEPEAASGIQAILALWPGGLSVLFVEHRSLEMPEIPMDADIVLLDSEFFVTRAEHDRMNGAVVAEELKRRKFTGTIAAIPNRYSRTVPPYSPYVFSGKTHLHFGFGDAIDEFIAFMNLILR